MSDRPIDIHIDELTLDDEPPEGLDAAVTAALRRLMDPSSADVTPTSPVAEQIAAAIHAQLPHPPGATR